MTSWPVVWTAVGLLGFVLSACGSSDDDTETNATHGVAGPGGSGGSGGEAAAGAGVGGGLGGSGGAEEPIGVWTANVRVSGEGEFGFEPAIAASADGHVYIPYCEVTSSPRFILAVSKDGGQTFDYPVTDDVENGMACDVTAAADENGSVYVAWIRYYFGATELDHSDVMLVASHDHGETWSEPAIVNSGDVDPPILNDRPWLALGSDGGVHLTFAHIPMSEFLAGGNNVAQWYTRSDDAGTSFSPLLQATPPSPDEHYLLGSFGVSVIGDDVLVPYADIALAGYALKEVGLMRLTKGAAAFVQEPVVVPSKNRASKGFPSVGGTPTASCFAFAGPDDDSSGLALELRRSTDSARRFGAPDIIANKQHGMVSSSVAANDDGECVVVWLDDRSGEEELYATLAHADGTHLEPLQVNDAPLALERDQTNHGGDYLNAWMAGRRAFTAWGDRRTGVQGIYSASMRVK
jgi:hypothetical protein